MIYEIRTYTFEPGRLEDFVAAFEAEALPVLAPRLLGFWRAESGILNRAVHLWEHEDRTGRAHIRAKNARDLTDFASKALSMMREQHSLLCDGEVNRPAPLPTSVFDLVSAEPLGDDVEIGGALRRDDDMSRATFSCRGEPARGGRRPPQAGLAAPGRLAGPER